MRCSNCGAELSAGCVFCPKCGRLASAPESAPAESAAAPRMSKKAFYKACGKPRKLLIASVCFIYASMGVTLLCIAFQIMGLSVYSLLDVMLMGGLGLTVHLTRSRIAAILLLAFGLTEMILRASCSGSCPATGSRSAASARASPRSRSSRAGKHTAPRRGNPPRQPPASNA